VTNSARIAINALECTSIEFILANKVVNTVVFNYATSMGLHVLVCTCCSDGCTWNLTEIVSSVTCSVKEGGLSLQSVY
jgi:hypothetical protein